MCLSVWATGRGITATMARRRFAHTATTDIIRTLVRPTVTTVLIGLSEVCLSAPAHGSMTTTGVPFMGVVSMVEGSTGADSMAAGSMAGLDFTDAATLEADSAAAMLRAGSSVVAAVVSRVASMVEVASTVAGTAK